MVLECLVRECRSPLTVEQEDPVLHRREDLIPEVPCIGGGFRLSLELLNVEAMLCLAPLDGAAQGRPPDPHTHEEPCTNPEDDRGDVHV